MLVRLVRRAFKVCTKDYLLEMELYHLETTFVEIKIFPVTSLNVFSSKCRQKWMLYQTQQTTTQLKKTLLSTKSFNVLFPKRAKRENTSWRKLKKSLKSLKDTTWKHVSLSKRNDYLRAPTSRIQSKKNTFIMVYKIECPDWKIYWRNWEKNWRAVQRTRWKITARMF